MPAISLGFEQVEARLGLIRRRLNLFALQHTLYLSASLVALSAALLIFLAVRSRAEAFELGLWIVFGGGLGICSWAAYTLHRRWLSIENVARLADQKGGLDDRLSTLLARRGKSPTRLWSLLLTQALALSSQWDSRVVAPRRIPRSLFCLLGSLAVLVATALFVRPPSPAVRTAGSVIPSTAATDAHHPQNGEQEVSSPAPLGGSGSNGAGAAANDGDGDVMPTRLTADNGQPARNGKTAGHRAARAGATEGKGQGSNDAERDASGSTPARMQNLIRRLFGVPSVADGPRRASARMPPDLRRERNLPRESSRTSAEGGRRLTRSDQPRSASEDSARRLADVEPGRDASEARGGSKAGGQGGSESGELFAGRQAKRSGGETKPFILRLTTFSSNAPTGLEPQRDRRRATVSDVGLVPGAGDRHSPTERTTPDDPIQRTEIAAEHEAILRRIFTRN